MSESLPPTITPQQLRDKALLALEEAIQECRYRTPRRTRAQAFALAYLWAYAGVDRDAFVELWRALGGKHSPWSFGVADTALEAVYRALGLTRSYQVSQRMWEARFAEENARAAGSATAVAAPESLPSGDSAAGHHRAADVQAVADAPAEGGPPLP